MVVVMDSMVLVCSFRDCGECRVANTLVQVIPMQSSTGQHEVAPHHLRGRVDDNKMGYLVCGIC